MVTLGFNTFIIKPFLYNLVRPILETLFCLKTISLLPLNTTYDRYNRYPTPKSFITKKIVALFLINVETPNAKRLV